MEKVKISGIPERILIVRTYYDENWIKHIVEEEYEYIDHIEAGAELVIRYRFRQSKEPVKPTK